MDFRHYREIYLGQLLQLIVPMHIVNTSDKNSFVNVDDLSSPVASVFRHVDNVASGSGRRDVIVDVIGHLRLLMSYGCSV